MRCPNSDQRVAFNPYPAEPWKPVACPHPECGARVRPGAAYPQSSSLYLPAHDFPKQRNAGVIRAAAKHYIAVQRLVVACGYDASNVMLVTDPERLQKAWPGSQHLVAAVSVHISSFAFENVADVNWDGLRFELKHYGWRPTSLPVGVLAEALTESAVGFWKE